MTISQSHHLRLRRRSLADQVYLVTAVTRDREPLFADFDCARLLIGEMRRLEQEARLQSQAFVVMPDHLHWLVSLSPAQQLSDTVRLLKGRTARSLNLQRKANGAIWQAGFHDRALRPEEDMKHTARCVVASPVRAGLVKSVRQYPHWDAVWI